VSAAVRKPCTTRRTNDDFRPDARRDSRSATPPRWRATSSSRGRTAGRRRAPSRRRTRPDRGPSREGRGPGKKLVVLDMFPYPSGAGLHVGTLWGTSARTCMRATTACSASNVLHCLGYDASGCRRAVRGADRPAPAQDDRGQHGRHAPPAAAAGSGFDERRTYATIDEDYFRWTQWIFLQIYNSWYDPDAVRADGGRGAARPIETLVEAYASGGRPLPVATAAPGPSCPRPSRRRCWPRSGSLTPPRHPSTGRPGLGTVLSNEEVTNEGRSERGTSRSSGAACASG
jgi:leucyl-tRNA synthetase